MNIKETIHEIQAWENYRKLPKFIVVEDISESQIKIDGIWQNKLYAWGILYQNEQYSYFETDDEKGYLSFVKTFDSEDAACQYAISSLNIKHDALTAERRKKWNKY